MDGGDLVPQALDFETADPSAPPLSPPEAGPPPSTAAPALQQQPQAPISALFATRRIRRNPDGKPLMKKTPFGLALSVAPEAEFASAAVTLGSFRPDYTVDIVEWLSDPLIDAELKEERRRLPSVTAPSFRESGEEIHDELLP